MQNLCNKYIYIQYQCCVLKTFERKLIPNCLNEIFCMNSHHTSMTKYEMENIDDTFNVNLFDQPNGRAWAICGYHGTTGTRNACNTMDNNNSEYIR